MALKIVRNADGIESASEQLYQVVGAGTSTIESVPCAIAMVELAQTDPNRCAILCANLGGDTDTIGRWLPPFVARCTASARLTRH